MCQSKQVSSVTVFLVCVCIIYILLHCIVAQWDQRKIKLQNVKVMPVYVTDYQYKNCFHLSLRPDLELNKLRDIAILNAKEAFGQVGTLKSIRDNSDSCKRFVFLEKIHGRLGNQMFQVSAVIGVAYKYDMIPVLQDRCLLAEYINMPNTVKTMEIPNNVVRFKCNASAVFKNYPSCILNSTSNITMYGTFQSWMFFEQAKFIIRKVFTLKKTHIMNANVFWQKTLKSGCQKVCIHVRRGDFTSERLLERGYTVANLEFIERAKRFYLKKYSNVQFVVLSNDKDWCKMHLKEDVISNFTEPGDDMALMSLCDHVVVTSGTFGWWGAWLSAGTTVYFKGFPRPGSRLDRRHNRQEYYPPHWIGL